MAEIAQVSSSETGYRIVSLERVIALLEKLSEIGRAE